MVAHVRTVVFQGVDVVPVDVQVQLAPGLPGFTVVGLPDKAVAESRERVRAAMASLGIALPPKKIVVNLAPADLAKEGSHFDLPIALGVLQAMDVIPSDALDGYIALGELGLDGAILPVAGVLPAAIHAMQEGYGIICPEKTANEATWAGELTVVGAPGLLALINHLKGSQLLPDVVLPELGDQVKGFHGPDLREVRGQTTARRALEVAAAGGHNLLMVGPPGAGKSMLASCLPGILPPLSAEERLESSIVSSVAGVAMQEGLHLKRPFRDPHHSSSMAAMVGGGRRALPGEISLAHHGVLFLDEIAEFPRGVLEALRQPLETATVTVARVNAHVTYPAQVQLIAAMNPCRCGYLGDPGRACSKAPRCGSDYQAKLSGPLLDRIDIHVDVPAVEPLSMLSDKPGEPSEAVADRVNRARERQLERFQKIGLPCRTNAELSGDILHDVAKPDADGQALLEDATKKLGLSMRGYTRVLRVSRTLADLAGVEQVRRPHIAEAVTYRQLHSA